MPFDQVSDLIAEIMGRSLDGEVIRRILEGVGAYAEGEEQAAVEAAITAEPSPEPIPGLAGNTLIVAVDGAMVNTRKNGEQGWHEAKIGICSRGDPRVAAARTPDDAVWDGHTD